MISIYRKIIKYPILYIYSVATLIFFYFNTDSIGESFFYFKWLFFLVAGTLYFKFFYQMTTLRLDKIMRKTEEQNDGLYNFSKKNRRIKKKNQTLTQKQFYDRFHSIVLLSSTVFLTLPGIEMILLVLKEWQVDLWIKGLFFIAVLGWFLFLSLKKIQRSFQITPSVLLWILFKNFIYLNCISFSFFFLILTLII